jgi:hypothetical protein
MREHYVLLQDYPCYFGNNSAISVGQAATSVSCRRLYFFRQFKFFADALLKNAQTISDIMKRLELLLISQYTALTSGFRRKSITFFEINVSKEM